MANYIDPYNPIFYAQESLAILKNAMGMANRVYRGFDQSRAAFERGETIQIPKPGSFQVQDGGAGTYQDVDPQKVSLVLSGWKEVKFGLSDKELAFTGSRIIDEHIAPATYALANYVDAQLVQLAKQVPWAFDASSSLDYENDFLGCRKKLRDIAGQTIDLGNNYFAVDSTMEQKLLAWETFRYPDKGADDPNYIAGSLGTRAGVSPFVDQNLYRHTSGTVVSNGTDIVGALAATYAKRTETITVSGLAAGETIVPGDSFVIAGNDQRYTATETVTVDGSGNAVIPIYPALVQDYASGANVTFEDAAATNAEDYYASLMFHRDAFAVAFAPLPETGNQLGANMATIVDPDTQIAIRSRMAYIDGPAKISVTLDILFGVKCIEPNRAVVFRRAA